MTTYLLTHRRSFRLARCLAGVLALAVLLTLPGCVRVLVMGAKVFAGDPEQKSAFEQRTSVDLQDSQTKVAIVVDVPHVVADGFDSLAFDLQDELVLRLQRHKIQVANPDEVVRVLEAGPQAFSAAHLAQRLDVSCIIHVQVEQFTDRAAGSSSLLQCRAQGLITAYGVRGTFGAADRHAIAVFEEPFLTTYPSGHPLPAEQVPRKKFLQASIRQTADDIGRQFYDVRTSDLF